MRQEELENFKNVLLEKKQAIEASVEEMMKNRDNTKYFSK